MAKPKQSLGQVFTNGLFKQNPTFVQFLGMCPTLAVTGFVSKALGMGAGVIFVLIFSNLIISLIRNFVPREVRIPIYIVVIAALVTILEIVMEYLSYSLYEQLGVFLSLIVVNCIILGRAEAFASKNGPVRSMVDGLGMGLGFTGGITLIALFREILGNGTITIWENISFTVIPKAYTIGLIGQAAGAFLVFGILVSQVNKMKLRKAEQSEVA
jgi:electron transport complex protein RnfE